MERAKERNASDVQSLRATERILGRNILSLLSQAEFAESFLVHRKEGHLKGSGLDRYEILLKGPDLSELQRQDLGLLILDPRSYFFGKKRSSPPHPDLALRLWRRQSYVDLLVCFYTSSWEFSWREERRGFFL